MTKKPPVRRPGSTVFVQQIRAGFEAPYREWSRKINSACAGFPGFLELEVFEPATSFGASFVIVVRFGSGEQLAAWQNSEICRTLLKEADSFLEQEITHVSSSVFGSWFDRHNEDTIQQTPPWKEALTVLLALYPAVMVLNLYLLGPFISDWPPAIAMYLSNMASVSLLTWALMPFFTNKLSFWLRPPADTTRASQLWGLTLVLGSQFLAVLFFHFFT